MMAEKLYLVLNFSDRRVAWTCHSSNYTHATAEILAWLLHKLHSYCGVFQFSYSITTSREVFFFFIAARILLPMAHDGLILCLCGSGPSHRHSKSGDSETTKLIPKMSMEFDFKSSGHGCMPLEVLVTQSKNSCRLSFSF